MKDIFVYIDTGEPTLMGVLHNEVIRGKEVFSYMLPKRVCGIIIFTR